MQRRNNLDLIRGLAMILVVIGHEIGILEGKGVVTNPAWHVAFQAIYEIHMPILFGISGYLIQGKVNRDTQIGKMVWKNVLALYVPFLILTYVYFLERLIANASGTQLQVPLDTSFAGVARLAWYGNGRLEWFLLSLLMIRLLYIICSKLGAPLASHIVYITAAVLMIWFGYVQVVNYMSYGVFFSVGCLASRYEIPKRKLPTLPICILLIVLGLAWSGAGLSRVDVISKLLIGGSVTVLLLMLPEVPRREAFCFFGKYSMVLYMVHGLTQNILFTILTGKIGLHNGAIELLTTLLLQITIAAVVIWMFESSRIFGWVRYIFYPDKLCTK